MPSPPLSFLTLPPDLRQRIYTILLVSPTPLKGPTARLHEPETSQYDIHTAILRVNRQTHNEARHVFLGLNTFHITSSPSPPCPSTQPTQRHQHGHAEEGSGAFEPPLQLKDLHLVRQLEADLMYFGKPHGADRYLTSLSFLLHQVKSSLSSLRITADARPYTTTTTSDAAPPPQHESPFWPTNSSSSLNQEKPSASASFSEEEQDQDQAPQEPTLDIQKFLTGFRATGSNRRFRDALAHLVAIDTFGLRIDFAESHFDFDIGRDVLLKSNLAHLAGQVLVARTEIGIQRALDALEETEVQGQFMEGL